MSVYDPIAEDTWRYGVISRVGKSKNIIWRDLGKVNCKKCKEVYLKENS